MQLTTTTSSSTSTASPVLRYRMSIPERNYHKTLCGKVTVNSLSLGLTKNSNAKFGIVITFALNSEQKFHYMKPADVPRKKSRHYLHSNVTVECISFAIGTIKISF